MLYWKNFRIYKHYMLSEIKRNDFVQLMLIKPYLQHSYSVHWFIKGKDPKNTWKLKIQWYWIYQDYEFVAHIDKIYRDYTLDPGHSPDGFKRKPKK
jgi:hypothetical protein